MIHALENERVETITPDRAKEFAEHEVVTSKINKRPGKCPGYKISFEVYYSKTLHLFDNSSFKTITKKQAGTQSGKKVEERGNGRGKIDLLITLGFC